LINFLLGFLLIYLTIIIVGAWRISHDFATEEGPAGLYGAIRRGIKAWVATQVEPWPAEDRPTHNLYWLYVGINCPRCISFTVALFALLVATSPLAWPLALWWGIAGCITFIDKVINN
jgi:hypothetical protein